MLGAFHELSLATADIRASIEFYERLGFIQCPTGDVWSHPYGVVSDGRLALGLHQEPGRASALAFVRPGVAQLCAELERGGTALAFRRIESHVFNQIGLRDPAGHLIVALEARTYSPPGPVASSACGYFSELSLPAADFAAAQRFWEALGFVAVGESDEPWPHLTLTSDSLSLAFHRPSTLDRPLLVFAEADMTERIARLRELGLPEREGLPRGLDPRAHALLEAPEGTLLALVTGAG